MATQALSEEILDELGEEFSARIRQGKNPSISEFLSRFEDGQRNEVREFLESIAMLEDLKTGDAGGTSFAETIPEQFGRYHIEKSLGEGGMGAVYLAHDSQLDRKVALKTPKFSKNSDPNLIGRFYREARSAATLQHPNICPVYDVGEIDGIHYISMAYIEGRPLSDCIQSKKFPPVESVLRIVRKVALALHEAHQQGLVHRDLKPANIMIGRRNEPIVMDFGLARQFGGDEAESGDSEHGQKPSLSAIQNAGARLTLDGTVVGSPGYMSPEQLMDDHKLIGPASDVYALGVVLYELLTRELPFPGDGTLMSVVNSVMSDETPDASVIRPKLESRVVAVCRKAMAKKVADRYPSMQAFAVGLSKILKSESSTGTDPVSAIADVPVSPELVRTKEQYELARSLDQEGQFAAAVSILEKMVAGGEKETNQFTKWARAELPKARKKAEKTANEAENSDFSGDDLWAADFGEASVATTDYGAASTRNTKKRARRKKSARWKKNGVVVAASVVIVLVCGLVAKRSLRDPPSTNVAANAATKPAPSHFHASANLAAPEAKEKVAPAESEDSAEDNVAEVETSDPGLQRDFRPRDQRQNRRLFDRLWSLDLNDDQLLSRSEIENADFMQPFLKQKFLDGFARFDLPPKDGQLSKIETQRMMKIMMSRKLPVGRGRPPLGRDRIR